MPDTTTTPDLLDDLCRRLVACREKGIRFELRPRALTPGNPTIRTVDGCCPLVIAALEAGAGHYVGYEGASAARYLWPRSPHPELDAVPIMYAADGSYHADPVIRRRLLEACGVGGEEESDHA